MYFQRKLSLNRWFCVVAASASLVRARPVGARMGWAALAPMRGSTGSWLGARGSLVSWHLRGSSVAPHLGSSLRDDLCGFSVFLTQGSQLNLSTPKMTCPSFQFSPRAHHLSYSRCGRDVNSLPTLDARGVILPRARKAWTLVIGLTRESWCLSERMQP